MEMKFQNLEISVNESPQGDSFVFEGRVLIKFSGKEQALARALAENMGRGTAERYKVEQHSGARVIIAPIKAWSFEQLIEEVKQVQHDFDVRLRQILDHRALRTILEESEKVDAKPGR